MKNFLLVACLLLLAGCVPPPPPPVPPHVSVRDDDFSQDIELTGPASTAVSDDIDYAWVIDSSVNKQTRAVQHHIVLGVSYLGNEKYFTFASDDQAKKLNVKRIYATGKGCRSQTCRVDERLAIIISAQDLEQHLDTGYRIRVSAKSSDEVILTLTPESIRMQLDAAAKYTQGETP